MDLVYTNSVAPTVVHSKTTTWGIQMLSSYYCVITFQYNSLEHARRLGVDRGR